MHVALKKAVWPETSQSLSEQCNKTQQQNTYLKLSGPDAACAFECLFGWQAIETLVALEESGSSS